MTRAEVSVRLREPRSATTIARLPAGPSPHGRIRDLKSDVVARLKARAKRRGRSLQTELKEILETASRHDMVEARAVAARIRRQLAGRAHSDSVELLAEDRSR